jgi:hypothetical protein
LVLGKEAWKGAKVSNCPLVTWITWRAISKEASKLLEEEGEKPREMFEGDGESGTIWVGASCPRTSCSRLVTHRRALGDVLGFVESRASAGEGAIGKWTGDQGGFWTC